MTEQTTTDTRDIGGYTPSELRAAIAHIRALPDRRRWQIWPRRERTGPGIVLSSWVDHAAELLAETDRLRDAIHRAASILTTGDLTATENAARSVLLDALTPESSRP